MPKATHEPITPPLPIDQHPGTTRRTLFTASAAIALAGGAIATAAASESGDAELLAACAAFNRADAEWQKPFVSDEKTDLLGDARDAAIDLVNNLIPKTPEGLRARAAVAYRVLMFDVDSINDEQWRDQAEQGEQLALDVLRQVAGLPEPPEKVIVKTEPWPPGVNPDAELIRTCAQHAMNLRAFNEAPDTGELDWRAEEDELWQTYEATRKVITTAQPRTIDGMVAIARAAMAEAGPGQKEADGQSFHGVDEHLAWNLVRDLLRLYGTAGGRSMSALTGAPSGKPWAGRGPAGSLPGFRCPARSHQPRGDAVREKAGRPVTCPDIPF